MDGEVGAALAAGLEKKGLIALGWYDAGVGSFCNAQKPINTPADVEGLKIRAMNNDLFGGMIESMGGNATPMAFAEVYQSLKTGVLDVVPKSIRHPASPPSISRLTGIIR